MPEHMCIMHDLHTWYIPLREVTIERLFSTEHHHHVRNAGHVPFREIAFWRQPQACDNRVNLQRACMWMCMWLCMWMLNKVCKLAPVTRPTLLDIPFIMQPAEPIYKKRFKILGHTATGLHRRRNLLCTVLYFFLKKTVDQHDWIRETDSQSDYVYPRVNFLF